MKQLKNYLWVLPFISFIFGYQLLSFLYSPKSLRVPQLVGASIQDGISSLSALNLNVRILAQKIDSDLPEGLILNQSPSEGQPVKAYQSVYLVVTKRPAKNIVPNIKNLDHNNIIQILQDKKIHLRTYSIDSNIPKNSCLAQYPSSGQMIESKESVIAYISNGITLTRIFPLLKDKNLSDVKEFLDSFNIKYNINYKGPASKLKLNDLEYEVVDQRPISGSIVDISKPFTVQLTVKLISK